MILNRLKRGISMTEFDLCPDCNVAIHETHVEVCDISRCKNHGIQLLKCRLLNGSNECSPTKFSGFFPGSEEAIKRGWYSYLDENKTWQSCESTHPGASPDINRVFTELKWDSKTERFI
jgi:hypothetical protein